MNKVKYIIHRSKGPFRTEKDVLTKIIQYYQERMPGLSLVDKGLRFCLLAPDVQIDFDFGFHNMRYRDFSAYSTVISQGTCGVLRSDAQPGDLLVPYHSAALRINTDATKVRVYDDRTTIQNGMDELWTKLQTYEKSADLSQLNRFIAAEFANARPTENRGLAGLKVHRGGCVVEANRLFDAQELAGARAILKAGEEKREIPQLQKFLEKAYDGVDQSAKQMMDNVGNKLTMFFVATNKPYAGFPLTDTIRNAEDPGTHLPTYDRRKIIYLQALILGQLLAQK